MSPLNPDADVGGVSPLSPGADVVGVSPLSPRWLQTRELTADDHFCILATDGLWDVFTDEVPRGPRCRSAQSWCRCGRGVSPVPAQMWERREPSPGADVGEA